MNSLIKNDFVGIDALFINDFKKVIGIFGDNGIGKTTFLKSLQSSYPLKTVLVWQGNFKTQEHIKVKDLLKIVYEDPRFFNEFKNKIDFNQWDLNQLLEKKINLLSGGENQIVKIISSLLIEKDIYLLDEPFTFLDSKRGELLKKLIIELTNLNKKVVIVEHDLLRLQSLSDIVYTFKDNNLVELGK